MASFKYKPNRVKYRTEVKTLDELHTKIIGEFDNDKLNLKEKYEKIDTLSKELYEIENTIKTFTQEQIKHRAKLKEEIELLQNSIKKIESNDCEMEYYIKTSDIIFDYYDVTEGKYYNEKSQHVDNLSDVPQCNQETENENNNIDLTDISNASVSCIESMKNTESMDNTDNMDN